MESAVGLSVAVDFVVASTMVYYCSIRPAGSHVNRGSKWVHNWIHSYTAADVSHYRLDYALRSLMKYSIHSGLLTRQVLIQFPRYVLKLIRFWNSAFSLCLAVTVCRIWLTEQTCTNVRVNQPTVCVSKREPCLCRFGRISQQTWVVPLTLNHQSLDRNLMIPAQSTQTPNNLTVPSWYEHWLALYSLCITCVGWWFVQAFVLWGNTWSVVQPGSLVFFFFWHSYLLSFLGPSSM